MRLWMTFRPYGVRFLIVRQENCKIGACNSSKSTRQVLLEMRRITRRNIELVIRRISINIGLVLFEELHAPILQSTRDITC